MMKKGRVLIISNSRLESDPRVRRQVKWLQDNFEITVIAKSPAKLGEVEFFEIPSSNFRIVNKAFFSLFSILKLYSLAVHFYPLMFKLKNILKYLGDFDLIVVNDLVALPAVYSSNFDSKVVFDSHEYYPGQFSGFKYRLIFNPFFRWLSFTYLKRLDVFITVSKGVGDAYKKLGAPSYHVIYNAPEKIPASLSTPSGQGVKTVVKLIHHGGAQRLRKLELMLEMMVFLPDHYQLTLMLMPTDREYLLELKELAKSDERIVFKEPVDYGQIMLELTKYDLGIFLLPPVTENYLHALPNKFFEFLQAGLAVAIGPSGEMQRILMNTGAGVVAESFTPEAMANEIKKINWSEIELMKMKAKSLSENYNAEIEGVKFKKHINTLFPSSSHQ